MKFLMTEIWCFQFLVLMLNQQKLGDLLA